MDRKTRWIAAGGAAAVIVFVFLAAFLLKRGKTRKAGAAKVTGPVALPAPEGQAEEAGAPAGPGIEEQIESKLAEREKLQQRLEAEALNNLKLTPIITKTAEILAKHLREKVKKEAEVTAQILRSWVREEDS